MSRSSHNLEGLLMLAILAAGDAALSDGRLRTVTQPLSPAGSSFAQRPPAPLLSPGRRLPVLASPNISGGLGSAQRQLRSSTLRGDTRNTTNEGGLPGGATQPGRDPAIACSAGASCRRQ